MTAINFTFTKRQAFVAMDTAISKTGETDFVGHLTKAIALPHVRLVAACTGPRMLSANWLFQCMNDPDLAGIESLNAVATERLRTIQRDAGARDEIHAAYLFGARESTDEIMVVRYGSVNRYEPEILEPGLFVAPIPASAKTVDVGRTNNVSHERKFAPPGPRCENQERALWTASVQACTRVMPEQRDQVPLGIGGKILCTAITADSIHQYWLGELLQTKPPQRPVAA